MDGLQLQGLKRQTNKKLQGKKITSIQLRWMLDLNLDTSLSINWGARLTRWKLDCCFLTQGCKRSVRPTRIVASIMAVRSASSVTKRPGPKYHRTATNKSRTTKCLSRHPTKAPATGRPWFAACRQWFAACGQWFAACRQWFAAASAERVRPAGQVTGILKLG